MSKIQDAINEAVNNLTRIDIQISMKESELQCLHSRKAMIADAITNLETIEESIAATSNTAYTVSSPPERQAA